MTAIAALLVKRLLLYVTRVMLHRCCVALLAFVWNIAMRFAAWAYS